MNSKLTLLFPLCIIVIISGCESTPSYSTYTPPPSPPISINEHCPEGTVAQVVTDMRDMSTIQCVHKKAVEINAHTGGIIASGYNTAGIPIR